VLDGWCARIGRDPAEIERSIGTSVETNLAEGRAFAEAGARQITFGVGGPDYDLSPIIPWLAWRDEWNARSTSSV
jgi:hypothetical protein